MARAIYITSRSVETKYFVYICVCVDPSFLFLFFLCNLVPRTSRPPLACVVSRVGLAFACFLKSALGGVTRGSRFRGCRNVTRYPHISARQQ